MPCSPLFSTAPSKENYERIFIHRHSVDCLRVASATGGGTAYSRGTPPETWAVIHRMDRVRRNLVGDMHRAGVEFLAGTDTPNPYCFPGFSLHDELARLVEAGLSPMEALQTATLNPARYFDRLQDVGTVQPGKLADLVLLNANPLQDIHNTTNICAVVANGRFYDRAALDEFLRDAEHPVKPSREQK